MPDPKVDWSTADVERKSTGLPRPRPLHLRVALDLGPDVPWRNAFKVAAERGHHYTKQWATPSLQSKWVSVYGIEKDADLDTLKVELDKIVEATSVEAAKAREEGAKRQAENEARDDELDRQADEWTKRLRESG